jgi:meiotically up-regulated gene 157 (Mug157) protein
MKHTLIIVMLLFSQGLMAHVAETDATYISRRPKMEERLFRSDAIEKEIQRISALLVNPKLRWMFANCFPNTLDTTVHYDGSDGDDTFVYTGDIHAMWLRDSGAQVCPYLPYMKKDKRLRTLIRGVIRRQIKCINIDPYANAFNFGATGSEWATDETKMLPQLHERKWEIDSLCYPVRLAYEYWILTGDSSIFDEQWILAVTKILDTFHKQQRRDGHGDYRFMRRTDRAYDTVPLDGYGTPVKTCGLIASAFRPSDDATVFMFLVPSNFFAVSILHKASEVLLKVNKRSDLSQQCITLADEVEKALHNYAVVDDSRFGKIYAYEVDGYGNHLMMDDANVPSLLSMPYLGSVSADDSIYQNTRRFVLSENNPYFFRGKCAEGVGGPHVGYDMIWPMSIIMRAMTSNDDAEITECVRMLVACDGETGFMHESFNKDNSSDYTRGWFAWANTLFGELIIKLVDNNKLKLLNSI